ncbi:DeoR family transcriptional regulator [Belliella marina]|uniref:DeoR family transcriptional regulator n=1 Tax=Belliella marina TaxID=1644146 RepID=A0ABW4VK83_9BACT
MKKNGLQERQVEAILYTKKYGEITNSKYQEIADVSKATATRDIKELEDKGLLKNIGTKGSSAVYKLGVGS